MCFLTESPAIKLLNYERGTSGIKVTVCELWMAEKFQACDKPAAMSEKCMPLKSNAPAIIETINREHLNF